ncbi:unnamed protein product [Adineta steineri]|uniref:Uncharacterized protein n=1 Tax=Adineta steineri TaxID=433720 RepID=A0A816DV20_9BILA|nr:unnamed protein product [Adineta steineri]CAF1477669.1 unnamed protein product [Adineta steineri]CAF1637712.1 unnamed protein product [Adineta steineri]
MSIQYTAESALHLLEELYRAIDLSSQQQSPMSIDDSENLVQTLCHLSQLINHINQTGMCEQTQHLDTNRFNRKKMKTFITPHLNNYDENIYKDSVSIVPPHFQQSYGGCVLYHPIVLHENDFASRSRSRGSRLSRQSRRSSRGRTSQSHDRSLRSSRRSSRSSRREHQRAHSRGRSRSRRRRGSSHKRRSTDRQYFDRRQIPSRPVSTTTTPLSPSKQMGSTSVTNQSSSQQPNIQPMFSSVPSTTTNIIPTFAPTIPLPPPPITSSLHHSHPLNDQSLSLQQVPVSANIQQQQQPTSLMSPNSLLNSSTQNDTLSSSIPPLQTTTTNTFTSRSDNCPECRAITRLLQWAPLKCYDAAGIQRGVFLAGPKSEQLLKALYSSIQDSAFSLDDIEDCLCDNE